MVDGLLSTLNKEDNDRNILSFWKTLEKLVGEIVWVCCCFSRRSGYQSFESHVQPWDPTGPLQRTERRRRPGPRTPAPAGATSKARVMEYWL